MRARVLVTPKIVMAAVGTLADEALKRKERLKSLRKQGIQKDSGEPPGKRPAPDEPEELPKPIFRNYKPQDDNLKESQLPRAQPAKVEDIVKDHLEMAKPEPVVEEVDLINLAPRKPDWDLKRDVAKKLEKLEKRTQRAIAELIRERLQEGNEDLAMMVNAQTTQVDEDDD